MKAQLAADILIYVAGAAGPMLAINLARNGISRRPIEKKRMSIRACRTARPDCR